MFSRRTRSKASAAPKEAAKDVDKYESFYKTYRDADEDQIGPEGVEKLCEDLALDPADRKVLILAWKLGAKKMGFFTHEEFVNGVRALRAADTEKLGKALAAAEGELGDPDNFRDFHQYAFRFCCTEPRQKILDLETATQMLQIVMRDMDHVDNFVEFLNSQHEYKTMNLDQWMSFFRFCEEVGADCSNYDESQAWPLLLDSFVEWVQSKDKMAS